MTSRTCRASEDIYFRGNGRWSKVVQHSRRRDDGKFDISYTVAADYEGTFVSHREIQRYGKRSRAIAVAKDWVEYGA